MTKTCPRCGSTDCGSNKFPSLPIGEIANGAIALRHANWFGQALSELLVWIGIQAANRFRPDWKCNYCNTVF